MKVASTKRISASFKAFNRTIEELKAYSNSVTNNVVFAFNRTIEELKDALYASADVDTNF